MVWAGSCIWFAKALTYNGVPSYFDISHKRVHDVNGTGVSGFCKSIQGIFMVVSTYAPFYRRGAIHTVHVL